MTAKPDSIAVVPNQVAAWPGSQRPDSITVYYFRGSPPSPQSLTSVLLGPHHEVAGYVFAYPDSTALDSLLAHYTRVIGPPEVVDSVRHYATWSGDGVLFLLGTDATHSGPVGEILRLFRDVIQTGSSPIPFDECLRLSPTLCARN
ncbi:MAG TPA: hypothetical protein VJN95_05535 [Gemmatimonadales bacterium]|nr:hypothetical protein [Gemmatimonadales bacterium]